MMTFLKFLFAMFLSFLPGLIGIGVAPMQSNANIWYDSLNNSVLTPEGWVFSVVWTILYFLIGLALFLIMQKDNVRNKHDKTNAYIFFTINLVFNTLWTLAFFGAGLPEVALIILTGLVINVIFMARAFLRISRAAFWLIVPYILWLMFAFYLNGMILYLN